MKEKNKVKKEIFILLAVFLILSFTNAWKLPFVETSDARYADGAFEMIANNDYLIPTMYGKAHLDKPPLTYLLSALSMKLFGINELACRLPQTILNFLFLVISYIFYRKMFDSEIAFKVTLALNLTIPLFAANHVLTTDFGLFFCEITALYCFAMKYIGKKSSGIYEFLFWLMLSLSFFIKGPLGFIIVIPIAVIFVCIEKNWKRLFRLRYVFSFIASFIAGASWYLYLVGTDSKLFKYFVYDQFLKRLGSKHIFHIEPWYFFLMVFVAGSIPWGILIFFKNREGINNTQNTLKKFLILISVFPLLFFSIPSSKLPFYIALAFAGFIPYLLCYKKIPAILYRILSISIFILLFACLINVDKFKLRTTKWLSQKIIHIKKQEKPKIFIYKVKAHCCWLYTGIKPIAVDLPEHIFSLEKDDGLSSKDILKSWNSEEEVFIVASSRTDNFVEFKENVIYTDRHYRVFWNKK
ncbi:glycosyltransferase family 39 protein [bacterium]|nr:glycosyltransferase family 39 protein [bacterium]